MTNTLPKRTPNSIADPAVSIVIVNWNTREFLRKSLQCAYEAIEVLRAEVIVVDNGSMDGSCEVVRDQFPDVQLIENEENLGFAKANNQGIQASRGRYILLLNSDAFLVGDAIKQMAQVLDTNGDIGIVGGSLFFPDGRPQPSHGPLPTFRSELRSLFGLDKASPASEHSNDAPFVETGTVVGACMLVRREVFEEVGALDESFFMFSEEVDLCFRAQQAGWKVVHLPSARVIHVGGGSTGQTPARVLMLYRGKLQYFAKHFGEPVRGKLFAAMRAATLVKLAVYTILRKVSFERVRKDELWRVVYQGLGER